ncbi:MAG TPA: hypothetical protein DC022_11430 [Alcanivorax sp.]|nr:hypothetical protein [Alcanivorax sp.]HBC19334.1 hypothetical protein [Alcanivorax sp.]
MLWFVDMGQIRREKEYIHTNIVYQKRAMSRLSTTEFQGKPSGANRIRQPDKTIYPQRIDH